MTWAERHRESELLASEAEAAIRMGDRSRAQILYAQAADAEDAALAALDLARRASPDGELLSDRPWLKESIFYRAPMIHPLNLLQIQVLARTDLSRQNELLFRETVTGIAAGMLTTG